MGDAYRIGGAEKLASLDGVMTSYPFAVKLMAARARRDGATEQAVMEAFGLRSAHTLRRWEIAYAEHGAAGLGGDDREEAAVLALGTVDIRPRLGNRHSDAVRTQFAGAVAAGHGYEAATKIVGIPFSTGWAWYQKVRTGGPLALGAVTRPSIYPASFKLDAAKAVVDDGQTRAEVMTRFQIRGHSTLQEWVQRYRRYGDAAFDPRRAARKPPARSRRVLSATMKRSRR